jgi:N-acetylglutamate synthase/N-acetylornithine aminotransferase
MAVTATPSNHAKYMILTKKVDFLTDVFKAILMKTSFEFSSDTHGTLADVTASQIATGNGYIQNSMTLSGVTIAENSVTDLWTISWEDLMWTASGGSIEAFNSMIIYDDSTTDDTVIACINFSANHTITDSNSKTFQNIGVSL